VPDVIDVDWGACENDVAERSICAPAMGIDSDALIVESCLTPAATGFRPRACHWDRMTVDMVGHRSKVTEAMFYIFVSRGSMTRCRNSWQNVPAQRRPRARPDQEIKQRQRPQSLCRVPDVGKEMKVRGRWSSRDGDGPLVVDGEAPYGKRQNRPVLRWIVNPRDPCICPLGDTSDVAAVSTSG